MQLISTAFSGLAAAGAEETNPLLPHTSELIFGLVVFAILFLVVRAKVVPTLEKMYAERTAAIEGGMDKADQAQREAEAIKQQYEAQLAESRTEAARIREESREQGAAIVAELRGQAQAEAARIVESAHQQIAADQQHAMVQLRGEVGRLSTDLASRIVGESLHSETRQSGIIERFLVELESGALRPESASDRAER
ncbi:MAG TPA: F0F1 ATP synthase subunit B [Dermatophilaceae bacterium]|nr:F0F1 ATP synthase subunit B [Dermatophilaceae bacterium]